MLLKRQRSYIAESKTQKLKKNTDRQFFSKNVKFLRK